MTSHTLSANFWTHFIALVTTRAEPTPPAAAAAPDDRTARAFATDLLLENPNACASELDVQGLMRLYYGSY